jgi:hypothetical protein
MTQYILLIHGNCENASTQEEWEVFFTAANHSGLFEGGSEIGKREIIGDTESAKPTDHIVGYMRFNSDDKQKILNLLEKHPGVIQGGSVLI